MPDFLSLPRELRDMIYTSLLLSTAPLPTLSSTASSSGWTIIQDPSSIHHGDWGSAFSLSRTLPTCANLLACNRQIHAEMKQAIDRVRRKGHLEARLDCLAVDESFHYFTWLRVPLVRTEMCAGGKGKGRRLTWTERVWDGCRFLAVGSGVTGECAQFTYRGATTTTIERLRIDVRLYGDRKAKWQDNQTGPERTSWAICAALKRFFDGDLGAPDGAKGSCITVEDLVINVLPPRSFSSTPTFTSSPPASLPSLSSSSSSSPSSSSSSSSPSPSSPVAYLAEDFPLDAAGEGMVHPQSVARELTDVWNKIWAANEYKGEFYRMLLRKIGRVRVCVDGEGGRWRVIKGELERGQAERKRITARTGW